MKIVSIRKIFGVALLCAAFSVSTAWAEEQCPKPERQPATIELINMV